MSHRLKLFHQMQVASSALFRAADQRTRAEFDLTTTQLAVLFVLSRDDGLPISEIARTLAMGKSSLTGLVDRMCHKGLVRRCPSPEDGRITLVVLQPDGRALLERGIRETRKFNQALLAPFDRAEQDIIQRFLSHLAENAHDIINADSIAIRDTDA